MYVWERGGRVWIVENDVKLPVPLLDISDEVGWGVTAIMGCSALPSIPNFTTNGRFYLMYIVDRHHLLNFGTPSYDPAIRTTISTARPSDASRDIRLAPVRRSPHSPDPTSRLVLVGETKSTGFPVTARIRTPFGTLFFGTDGTLLATCGDGAGLSDGGSDPTSYYVNGLSEGIIKTKENVGAFRSQMVDSHSGKLLRIDPMTGDGVPSNPYYDPTDRRAPRSRVFALGLRNAFRMTLQPLTEQPRSGSGQSRSLLYRKRRL